MEFLFTTAATCMYIITRRTRKKEQEKQWTSKFIKFLKRKKIKCVVFDMDHTMSACHCGEGLPNAEKAKYIGAVSVDFVTLVSALALEPSFRLAVATGSDPLEYNLPGQSQLTHLLGPDLAKALIAQTCPKYVLPKFQIMVGYDYRLHGKVTTEKGKRYHMRKISKFYNIPFKQMLIIDDSTSSLKNEDGWHGMLVHDRNVGFTRFDIDRYTNSHGPGIEQLEYVVESVLKLCPWTSETTATDMISFTESEIREVKEEMGAALVNEEDLEEELGDLMFDVLLLMKICERDFHGRISYDRALQRCAKKIKDRCPHVFGKETAKTKEEAHEIWKRVKKLQRLKKEAHRTASISELVH
jgi:NTP pyrophosphatase (non-canonical NTP hydrolase)